MNRHPCEHCGKAVLLDQNGQPVSRYWMLNPDDKTEIQSVFCGPECSTTYYNENVINEPE